MRPIAARLLLGLLTAIGQIQERPLPPPISDMHVHALSIAWFETLAGPAPTEGALRR